MIDAPRLLLIGAAGRDAGKTCFAVGVINHFRDQHIVAVKVTVIQERDGQCPRGGAGCGVCTSLSGEYAITEETDAHGNKDTCRLLAAGAARVLWLRVLREKLDEGTSALFEELRGGYPIVCESNSLRHAVRPSLFIMLQNKNSTVVKASAAAVQEHANLRILSDGNQFDVQPNALLFTGDRWQVCCRAFDK